MVIIVGLVKENVKKSIPYKMIKVLIFELENYYKFNILI